jgi:hypothetical protein
VKKLTPVDSQESFKRKTGKDLVIEFCVFSRWQNPHQSRNFFLL